MKKFRLQRSSLSGLISSGYIDRMAASLSNWVTAGERGCLVWGILHFRKPLE